MKVIICASKSFDDLVFLKRTFKSLSVSWDKKTTKIVVGGVKGIDKVIRDLALSNWFTISGIYADVKENGENAESIKNTEIVDFCEEGDQCIVFWDGKDKVIRDLIEKVKKKALELQVFDY